MAHEQQGPPGTPGGVHAPPEGGLPGGLGDQRGVFPPAESSGFVASDSIFGWSWLGHWAENSANAPVGVAGWLQGWVDKFNQAAEAELSGDTPGTQTTVIVEQFLADLDKQTWWSGDPDDPNDMGVTGLWQAVQKLRYGPEAAPGEYAALVQSYRDYVADAARKLGFADMDGNLTFDINGAEITRLIEGPDGLMLTAGSVVGGLPTPDPVAAGLLLDRYFLSPREFDAAEGIPELGPGELLDTYNWIKGLASDNFITLDDEEVWDMVSRFKREEMSPQGVWDRISGQVGDQYAFLDGTNIMNRINQFSSAADGSNWGGASSIKKHLAPVQQSIADTWELNLNEVNLGSVFGSGLEGLIKEDEDGNATTFMNSLEAKRWARSQDQWKDTTAYKSGMSGITQAMLQSFGAR